MGGVILRLGGSTRALGVLERAGWLLPFVGERSSAVQPHWSFPVSGLASQVTCQLLHLVKSSWFWLFHVVLAQFSMTDICQFFRAPRPGCSHLLALQWGRSVLYSWSARCQADCEANACQSGWESPRGSWHGHSWLLFLVLPTSLYCAQGCTQHTWSCIGTIDATLVR